MAAFFFAFSRRAPLNLLRAGMKDDARAQFEWLLKNSKAPRVNSKAPALRCCHQRRVFGILEHPFELRARRLSSLRATGLLRRAF